jgi:DNA-binding response OmpR family regulator
MARDGAVVLVVDDDRANRLTLTALLEGEGYAVRAVADGEEALAALAVQRYDAVLLDLLMPGIGGLDVLAEIKADARLWRIPVLVISAVEDTASVVRCLELGAEDYVSKPFDPVVLRARINAALARRRFTDLEAEYHKLVEEQATELAGLRARLDACSCGAAATGPAAENP